MKRRYILAIDQGTTGSTALLLDISRPGALSVSARAGCDFKQHYPKPGWVEHDLDAIWASVRQAVVDVCQNQSDRDRAFRTSAIEAIGITNQRETICLFEPDSAKAVRNAIVWQCRRSSDICKRLKELGHENSLRKRTGLVLDPYFSATKLTWWLENDAEVKDLLSSGRALVGTIDSFLLYRLTGSKVFATEPSNASRTLLCDLETGQFHEELFEPFDIPKGITLAEIKDSAGFFGKTKGLDFLPDGIPITGILGDQQAALAGQGCFGIGEAKCTYGTGAFLLVNTGREIKRSKHGLVTTIAWSLGGERSYALEGSSFIAGAAVQFVRDQLGFISTSAQSQQMSEQVAAAPEIYFVPALSGLGAPLWEPNARGAFLGLTRGTTKDELVRATLEGVAFQVHDLVDAMSKDLGAPFEFLRVDGGAAQNDVLMRSQANISNLPVDRPRNLETTALGAGLFAGLGAGVYSSLSELTELRVKDQVFHPETSFADRRDEWLDGWYRAIAAVRAFAKRST